MNKVLSILFGAALAGAAASGAAADNMKQGKGMAMGMDMKMMDTNKDGMISKDEFTKHHEAMWEKMKKNKNGMVDMKDMNMMHSEMMKGDSMMKDGKMTKGDGMKDSMKK
jgi:aminopeptidase C